MKNTPELLAPAGNLKKLKFALTYGADAVYCGLPDFSLRYRINQFGFKELKEGIEFAHKLNKKVYITINIFPHKDHLEKLAGHIKELKKIKPDALIISDPGVLAFINEHWPEIELHLSTQANCTNWRSAKFWYDQGVRRVILARETTIEDIKEIRKNAPEVELETFVHGAMCMAYSGRCILSKWFTNRSANLGDCSQPCRWEYNLHLEEAKRPNSFFPIEEDANGTYIMNSKDLCLIEYLKELQEAGIMSFKIEGRAKSISYLGNTIHSYRQAIDNPKADTSKLLKELKKSPYRGFTTGFILGEQSVEHRFETAHQEVEWEFCGEVLEYKDGLAKIKVHNTLKPGNKVEIIVPHEKIISHTIKKLLDKNGNELPEAHGGQTTEIFIPIKQELKPMSLLRRKLK